MICNYYDTPPQFEYDWGGEIRQILDEISASEKYFRDWEVPDLPSPKLAMWLSHIQFGSIVDPDCGSGIIYKAIPTNEDGTGQYIIYLDVEDSTITLLLDDKEIEGDTYICSGTAANLYDKYVMQIMPEELKREMIYRPS